MYEKFKLHSLRRIVSRIWNVLIKLPVAMFLIGVFFGFFLFLQGIENLNIKSHRHWIQNVIAKGTHEGVNRAKEINEGRKRVYDATVFITYDPRQEVKVSWLEKEGAIFSVRVETTGKGE
jgi:hypothetical protein